MKIIGMISGTSFDGIDVACCDIVHENGVLSAKVEAFESYQYSDDAYQQIFICMPPREITMEQVCKLDTIVGKEFGEAAARISEKYRFSPDLIVSHGQTLFHWIDANGKAQGTLQLGEPTWIAQRTGTLTLSNTRARDVAAGGQGAPLVSVLDQLLLGDSSVPVGALNLGGISNITIAGGGQTPIAYDCGPANGLMDAAISAHSGGKITYDEDGAIARSGVINREILDALLAHPYYKQAWPKSTGKEIFHLPYIIEHFGEVESWNLPDVMATLLELTAQTVADDVKKHGIKKLYVAGGGSANTFQMERMSALIAPCELHYMGEFGIDPREKEALAFALIGFLTAHGLPGAIPTCTGAASAEILGSLTPGKGPISLPQPIENFPEKLKMVH